MDYKQKYEEALERMKSWVKGEHPECFSEAQKTAEFIFPELKESENDRIVRCLLNYFNHVRYNGLDLQGTDVDEVIAWLEKQGEQKSADKFEPKFKIGDWISNGRYVKKIIGINSDWPYYIFQDGSSYRIKDVDTKWYIMPNMDELEWLDAETNENHCYSCELFDRKNNMCKCTTLCKDTRNTYKGFYIR